MGARLLLHTTARLHDCTSTSPSIPLETRSFLPDRPPRPTHPSAGCGSFACLRSLLLGGNLLSTWASVDALDALPALVEARLSDTPLTAAAPTAARYQCIARIGCGGGAALPLLLLL